MSKTIFCDIDGTIILQVRELSDATSDGKFVSLAPGAKEKFNEWNWKGYRIVLTTGRKESTREATEAQLRELGLFWDYLIMGLDVGGQRILINNRAKGSEDNTAFCYNLAQDEGLASINL